WIAVRGPGGAQWEREEQAKQPEGPNSPGCAAAELRESHNRSLIDVKVMSHCDSDALSRTRHRPTVRYVNVRLDRLHRRSFARHGCECATRRNARAATAPSEPRLALG